MFGDAAAIKPPMPFEPLSPALERQVGEAFARDEPWRAQALLAQALRSQPGHPTLQLRHATALGLCGRYTLACAAFEALLAALPADQRAHAHGVVGAAWRSVGRFDLAVPHFERAAADPAQGARVHAALAEAQERLNRLDAAADAAAEGLRRFPRHPSLELALARALRRTGQLERAEALLRGLLADAPQGVLRASRYELGHVLDAQGRYGEAFQSFQAAKAPDLQAAAGLLDFARKRLAYLRQGADLPRAEDFKRWAEREADASAKTPAPRQAFLIGCPRSGTTLLERVLDAHPQVAALPETPIWRCAAYPALLEACAPGAGPADFPGMRGFLDSLSDPALSACRRAYAQAAADALGEDPAARLILDKNPSLLPTSPMLVRAFPQAPLLMALRDPRAIVWSCFTQDLPPNPDTAAFLDLAAAAGQTAAWLEYWLRLRERLAAPWREVRYEDMVRDLPGEARKTLDFLGLPWEAQVLSFHQSLTPVRSPSYASASQPVHAGALDKWRHYEAFIAPHLAQIKPVMAQLGYAD